MADLIPQQEDKPSTIDKSKFNFWYLFSGDGIKDWWKAYGAFAKVLITLVVIYLIIFGLLSTYRHFFPSKTAQIPQTTVGHIESGGVSNITNIVNPSPTLKQGIYLRGATDKRGSAGVFKEVTPNVELDLGGGKDWDKDSEFVEVECRLKF